MMNLLLAWRPFLDPMPIDAAWWVLLVPLSLAISVVYKAIRLEKLTRLPREAGLLTVQIIAFMVLAAAGLWLLVEFV